MDNKEQKRKLTPAEQARQEKFDQSEKEMLEKGYEKKDLTIGALYANIMALVLALPPILIIGAFFFYFNNNSLLNILDEVLGSLVSCIIYFVVFIVLIVVHELIHGLFFAIFAKSHTKAVSFGVVWSQLIAYCACGEPLTKLQYSISVLMPTVILGVIPMVISVFTGSGFLLLMSAIMIFGGGGDMTIFLKLISYKPSGKEVYYFDHPTQIGLIAFEK